MPKSTAMNAPKYKNGMRVITVNGTGVTLSRHPHRRDPESDPDVWMYVVKLDRSAAKPLPYTEDELSLPNELGHPARSE